MEKFSFSSWFQGIKGRLLFAAFLPVVGFVILGAISYKGVTQIVSLLDVANQTIIPTFDTLGEMRQARQKFGYQSWAALGTVDPEARKKRATAARDTITEFTKAQESYTATPMEPDEAKLYDDNKANIKEYIAVMNETSKLLDAGTEQSMAEAKVLLDTRVRTIEEKIKDWNLGVKTMYQKMAADGVKEASDTQKSVVNTLVLVTLFSAFAIFGLLLWLAAKISNSVSGISNKLTVAGSQVATSVEQLNEAGNSLSQSSTEAAASLEETVAALEELTSMVQMNSDNAKQAASLSITSREAAERGEQEIHSLIESMKVISQSSKKIEEIISVIDDIAFQTNLLALNAAVEAARAGEQGKGFAVVAEAVRTLAQRSAEAAKDITTLIKASVSQIEDGRKIADQSGTVLSNITNSVKKVSDLNNEIAAASAEQTTGIQQIGKAMNQLDQSSQSNAASAEEIAATSGEISNLAVATQQLTHDLNGVILGAGAKSVEIPHLDSKHATKKTTSSHALVKKPAAHSPKNVVSFKRPSTPMKAAKSQAVDAIPFDEDDRAKVGTTDGF